LRASFRTGHAGPGSGPAARSPRAPWVKARGLRAASRVRAYAPAAAGRPSCAGRRRRVPPSVAARYERSTPGPHAKDRAIAARLRTSSVQIPDHVAVGNTRSLVDQEQGLAKLDGLPVFDQDLTDASLHFRGDLVHQFHRLDDAERLPDGHLAADF